MPTNTPTCLKATISGLVFGFVSGAVVVIVSIIYMFNRNKRDARDAAATPLIDNKKYNFF